MTVEERVRALELEVDDLKFVVNRMTKLLIDLEENMIDSSVYKQLTPHNLLHQDKGAFGLVWDSSTESNNRDCHLERGIR